MTRVIHDQSRLSLDVAMQIIILSNHVFKFDPIFKNDSLRSAYAPHTCPTILIYLHCISTWRHNASSVLRHRRGHPSCHRLLCSGHGLSRQASLSDSGIPLYWKFRNTWLICQNIPNQSAVVIEDGVSWLLGT